VLKVGRVGLRSGARFQYMHYNPGSAQSTVAGSLLKSKVLWRYLGITELNSINVGNWIREHTDRDHFYLEAEDESLLAELERFLRGILGPAFEGG